MEKQDQHDKNDNGSLRDEIKGNIISAYRSFEQWMRPSPSQPRLFQVLVFILKLPVLLLVLLLSPVVLILMLFVFFAAL